MAETAQFCEECARKLSPADKAPQERAFFNASLFTEGSQPVAKGPITEDGVCDKCGKRDVVTRYEDSTDQSH